MGLICAIRVFTPHPRHFNMLIFDFSLGGSQGESTLISGARDEVLFI
jgi:hypothetical protein